MNLIICNQHTIALAKKEAILSFKKCYLALQLTLLSCLERATTEAEKVEWQKKIQDIGQTYQSVMNR